MTTAALGKWLTPPRTGDLQAQHDGGNAMLVCMDGGVRVRCFRSTEPDAMLG
jgi:hypothetical protein